MTPTTGERVETARRRIELANQRAARAAETAERHERLARTGLADLREFHRQFADRLRGTQAAHLVAARIHTRYAAYLERWATDERGEETRPSFIHAVAAEARTGSAAVAWYGTDRSEAVVTASDPVSRLAQDVEFTLGEGPARQVAGDRLPVTVAGADLARRWPQYGRTLDLLGVAAVTAVPLGHRAPGTLTVFDTSPVAPPASRLTQVEAVAAGLTDAVLRDLQDAATADAFVRSPLLEEHDDRRVLHLAAGIVAEQEDCDLVIALALIRARGFAEELPSTTIAEQIVAGRLRLGGP